MDSVIDFRQFSFCRPSKLPYFLSFKSLELFYKVEFEWYTDCRAKLKGNIFVGISTSITPFFTTSPIALVRSIHSEALSTKEGNPALFLKWSNSTTLKSGL